jgi:hypothetical protein
MGEHMIQICSKMFNQLTRDDEKVKMKVSTPKPKKLIEQQRASGEWK